MRVQACVRHDFGRLCRWAAVALPLVSGCAGGFMGSFSGGAAPAPLPGLPAEGGRCRLAAGNTSPLVTEWPASEKANLEGLLSGGGIAVAFSGCSMRLMPQCRLVGSYQYQRTTPASDSFQINNEDDLYAKLPLGALSLQGELKRSGQLVVQTTVVGQVRLRDLDPATVPSIGDCAGATHVLAALSIGAFAMQAGASTEASAGAAVASIGEAGGKATRSRGVLRSAGDPASCGESTAEAPHANCRSPIQAFLMPLPGRGEPAGPPGTIKVDFVSASANSRWDVYIDDAVVCTTPCSKWVVPSRPVLMRAREEQFMRSPDRVTLSDLGPQAAGGALQVEAHPTAYGELATGIVFTSFGGMAALTGVVLAASGCPSGDFHSGGRCTAGFISLGVGGVVVAGSIWLILDALPKGTIKPSYELQLSRSTDPRAKNSGVKLEIGPGFVAGTF